MSEDEVMVTLGCIVASAVIWGAFALRGVRIGAFGKLSPWGRYAWLVPASLGALLYVLLTRIAASDVRDDPRYLAQYVAMGLVWVALSARAFDLVGLSFRDDVVERRNTAAVPACAGLVLGLTFAYAGANAGEGPGWWVVVYAAGLATLTFTLGAIVVLSFGGLLERLTIERDLGSGLRAGGLFIALGLIAGRGAAGNWVDATGANVDFVMHGWPMLVLVTIASAAEHSVPRTLDRRDQILAGVPLAVLYVGIGLAWDLFGPAVS